MGLLFPSMIGPLLFRNLTKSENLASAAAMLSLFRAFGQAAKVAIGGTVFQHQVRKKILGYPLLPSKAQEYSRDSSGLVLIIKRLLEGLEKMQYSKVMRKIVWVTMCALSAARIC